MGALPDSSRGVILAVAQQDRNAAAHKKARPGVVGLRSLEGGWPSTGARRQERQDVGEAAQVAERHYPGGDPAHGAGIAVGQLF